MRANVNKAQESEADLLVNLIEDMHVLRNSWRSARQTPAKIIKHLTGIVESALHVARDHESLEPLCDDIQAFLKGLTDDGIPLEEGHWQLVFDIMNFLKDSFQQGAVKVEELQQCQERLEAVRTKAPALTTTPAVSLQNGEPVNGDARAEEEEDIMEESVRSDVGLLLQRAQEAFAAGKVDDAKELALQASKLIAEVEAEETKKREKTLRTDLEMAILEESEAEETLKNIQDEMSDRTQELVSLSERLSEAEAAFEQQTRTCQDLKSQLDQVESELASLKKKHKDLLDEFQQSLPARDAAERECLKLKEQFDTLAPETQTLEDNLKAAESQLARARKKREDIEAQLKILASKMSA
ncbi:MAG: hypothetical protein Kow0099_19630 [Candidatus Abyssubacteria bacterium]